MNNDNIDISKIITDSIIIIPCLAGIYNSYTERSNIFLSLLAFVIGTLFGFFILVIIIIFGFLLSYYSKKLNFKDSFFLTIGISIVLCILLFFIHKDKPYQSRYNKGYSDGYNAAIEEIADY